MPQPEDVISNESRALLAEYPRAGAKPRANWLCGLELELFGYVKDDPARINARQVQDLLAAFARTPDRLYFEHETTLVELCLDKLGHLTVEPGGQIEYSGKARPGLVEVERDLRLFLSRLAAAAHEKNLLFLAVGFDPLCTRAEQHWFPKMRYDVMRPYLASRGDRSWDMMTRTCATQVSLDYDSEEDMARKFILGNRLAPIITAIFANSPFENGRPSGYKSTRAAAWLETDADRSGLSPLALNKSFTADDFVAYALEVPMIFLRRGKTYTGALAGRPFGRFLEEGDEEFRPLFQDWTDHLTTIFTDARLKQYVEMRSADCGNVGMSLALAALWKGLVYDRTALDEALAVAPELDRAGARVLREAVARRGLAAQSEGVNVLAKAKEIVEIAVAGLGRVAPGEVKYLDILQEITITDEVCPADILLRNWHGSWHGSMARALDYLKISP